ncbi:MAG: WYL domain-containing protein [Paludibacter sp.]
MKKSYHILRYLLIIRYVKNHPFCSKKEIIDYIIREFSERGDNPKLGLSERNLTRDFEEIRNTFGLSIDYNPTNRGYCIPQDEQQDPIVDQLMENLDLLHIGIDGGLPDFIQPEKRRSRGTEHLLPLKNAIAQNKTVKFEYKKFYPNVIEFKSVQPYMLKESRGRWYLLGLDSDKKAKSYGLDRITELEVLEKTFKKNTEIDWNEKYTHSFAMFTDEQVEKVILSFDERDGNYIEAMPIHSSQTIIRQGERVIVTLNIRITLDFIMELMSRSWSVEIITPLSLRQRLHEIYKEAMVRNG